MKQQVEIVLILLFIAAMTARAQSLTEDRAVGQATQVQGYWVDPSTGLMWTGKDNGNDTSYYKAMKYCHKLRLAGYSDWRLPTIDELQGIYDSRVNSPGHAGHGNGREFFWHVKGNLYLSGLEWSSSQKRAGGYGWYFDFANGVRIEDQRGYVYSKRASCVRRSGK